MTTSTSITVRVPLAIRHRPGRKTVVTPMAAGPTAVTTRADPALVKALARAFRYQRMLDEGRYASISEMAEGEKLDRGYMGRLLQLMLLAPDIVEAILDGWRPAGLDLPRLLDPFPVVWTEQRGEFILRSAQVAAAPSASASSADGRTLAPVKRVRALAPPSSA